MCGGWVGKNENTANSAELELGLRLSLAIMPSTMATYIYASIQGQRTHSARTNNLLADRDQYVQQLADEKAKSIFVKLIVDMFVIMLQKGLLLFTVVFHFPV